MHKKINTKDVLSVIAVGGIIVTSAALPGLSAAFITMHKAWKEINRKDFGRIMKRLQKQQMITFIEDGDIVSIEITEKGKRRLLTYDFENMAIKAKKRDGQWRLIIFDIPESKKKNRDAFRKKLLELGFMRLQGSVFASAFPCKAEIDFLCHYLEISDFVTLVVVNQIERGEELLFKRNLEST